MAESNVKLIRFIDKHPLASASIIFPLVILAVIGLGIGMTNIGNENKQKAMDTFESLSCEQLAKIPSEYGHWMLEPLLPENENEFLNSWNDNMQRCLK